MASKLKDNFHLYFTYEDPSYQQNTDPAILPPFIKLYRNSEVNITLKERAAFVSNVRVGPTTHNLEVMAMTQHCRKGSKPSVHHLVWYKNSFNFHKTCILLDLLGNTPFVPFWCHHHLAIWLFPTLSTNGRF